MKDNFADNVVDEVKGRISLVRDELVKEFKGTKKFRKEPMLPQEQEYIYSAMTPRDMAMALQQQTQFYQQQIAQILQSYPPEQHQQLMTQMYSPDELAREDINEFIYENEKKLRRRSNAGN